MAEEKAKNRANDVVVVGDSIQDFSHVGALINEYDFLAGYSNSQLKYQNLTLPLKIGWSIDRITIVGKLKDNILWDGRILVDFERLMRLNEDSGYLVALSPNSWKIIDKYKENIAYIEMSKFQKGYGRIDFNPNKVNEFISLGMKKFIHKLFLEPHFSRADVACDIVDVPDDFITQYRIVEAVGAKIFWGRDKKPETFYWGARSSERQVRLYNKKREQLKKRKIIPDEIRSWWRFEAQLRQGKASEWYSQIVDTLDVFASTNFLPEDISGIEKAVLTGLIADESLWAGLAKNTKRKYRDLLKQESQNDELTKLMRQTFSEQSDKLKMELDTWLAGFDVSEDEI